MASVDLECTAPAAGGRGPPQEMSLVADDEAWPQQLDEDHESTLPDMDEHGEGSATCPVCQGPAPLRCIGCLAVSYCGHDHQRSHWNAHRAVCRPLAIAFHRRLGRHLVATRDVRRGELLLRDRPLMVGPCRQTAPLCLGCYRPLAGGCRCRRCGWPLCSPACEQSGQHRAECDATARSLLGPLAAAEAADWFECVSVLRLLELRETDPAGWTALLDLQSHDVERRGTDAYLQEQRTVVERIRNRFGQFQHSEPLIHRICGIIDTNAYEIRLPEINVQGIYPQAALFEHDCVPNTHRTFDEDLTLVVRAAVDIAKGEHLTSIYTDNLWGTWQRREHLLDSKHFLCVCARCSDPSELGTGLSSLRCTHCHHGFIQPSEPLQLDSDYTCSTCGTHVAAASVHATLERLQKEVERVEEDPTIEACESLISTCSKVLHPNHHLILDLAYPLVHLYNSSDPLSRKHLDRKEQLCKQILQIADVLTPGISRLRGIILYELQQTLLQKARKLYKKRGKGRRGNVLKIFKEAREYLRQALDVLRWEPRVQPEGQLGLEAAEELAELDHWLKKHAPSAAGGALSRSGTANGGPVGAPDVTSTVMVADAVNGEPVRVGEASRRAVSDDTLSG